MKVKIVGWFIRFSLFFTSCDQSFSIPLSLYVKSHILLLFFFALFSQLYSLFGSRAIGASILSSWVLTQSLCWSCWLFCSHFRHSLCFWSLWVPIYLRPRGWPSDCGTSWPGKMSVFESYCVWVLSLRIVAPLLLFPSSPPIDWPKKRVPICLFVFSIYDFVWSLWYL